MKKMFLTALALSSILVPSQAQQTKILTADKNSEYGLIYTLPSTAFQIEVMAVKETKLAGPFYKYSNIVTSDSKVITEDEIRWNIQAINITPYGVPDPEKRYIMQLKSGSPAFIEVAEDGMLVSINKEVNMQVPVKVFSEEIEGIPATGKEYLEFVNEDFLSAKSSYKKAQLLGEELLEIRDAKLSLTRGTAETMPTDGRQLEIMLESLANQERALTNAFTGSSWKEKVVRTYTFHPEDEGKNILFRLSQSDGPVNADDLSGEPVYINVSVIQDAELPVDAKGEEKKLSKDAVMYCVPGVARITLSYLGNNIFQKDFEMSQFGMYFGLNPSIFSDKKEPSYAIFDPATGALKETGTVK